MEKKSDESRVYESLDDIRTCLRFYLKNLRKREFRQYIYIDSIFFRKRET